MTRLAGNRLRVIPHDNGQSPGRPGLARCSYGNKLDQHQSGYVHGAQFPYFFWSGGFALWLSVALSAGALALVGGTLSTVTGKNTIWGGTRMLLAGGAAAAVTYGVGKLIGVSLLG